MAEIEIRETTSETSTTAPVTLGKRRATNNNNNSNGDKMAVGAEPGADSTSNRRQKENQTYVDMAQSLPLEEKDTKDLDRASVLRVTIGYVKLRESLEVGDENKKARRSTEVVKKIKGLGTGSEEMFKALDGFLLVVSNEGLITFASESVADHLGLREVDVMGHNIRDLVHPQDFMEVAHIFADHEPLVKPDLEQELLNSPQKHFVVRMRSTFSASVRSITRCASFKPIYCSAKVTYQSSTDPLYPYKREIARISVICRIAGTLDLRDLCIGTCVMSKHDMGYNCVHVDNKMKLLLGYDPADMITSNAFVFFHPGDLSEGHVHTAHMQMMHTGENKSPAFRALTKWGSWVWVRSLKQCLYDPTSHQPTGIAIYTWLIGPEGAMECNRAFLNLYGSSHLPNAPEQFKSVLGDQYNPSECHNPSYVPIFPEQSSPPEAVALPKKDTEMKMSPSQQSASCQSIQQVTSPDQLETQPSDQQPRARPSDQRQPRPSDQRKLQPSGQRQPHPSAQQLHLYSSEVPVSATCTPVIQHSFSSIAGAPPTHLPINPNPSMSTAPLPHLLHGGSPPHPAMANNHPNIHSIPPSSLPYVGHASNSVMFQPVQQSLILQPFCAHPSLPLSGPAMGGTAYSSNGGDIKNSHQGNSAFSPPLTPPDNCTLPPVTCSVGQVNSTYSNHPQNHHHVSQRPEYHHQTPHGQVVVMDQTRMMYPSSSLSSSSAHSNPSLAQSMASAILSPPHDTTSTASLTSLPSTNSTFTDQFPKDYYLQNASFNMTPSPSSSENCFHSSFSPPGTGNQDTYTPSPLGIKSYADYSPNREAIPNNCLNGVNNFEPKSKGFSFGDITPDNFSDFNFNAPPTVLPNASSTCERNPGIHSNAAAYQATIDVGRQQQFVSVTTHSNLS